jgi:hypothetical protein
MARASKAAQKGRLAIAVADCRVRLQTGEPIVFVDARRQEDWVASKVKIAGALRLPSERGAPCLPCPKHNYIVVYCA